MKITTLRLPEELYETLETEAQDRDESVAAYVRTILYQRGDLDLNGQPNTLSNNREYDNEYNAKATATADVAERIDQLEARVTQLETNRATRNSEPDIDTRTDAIEADTKHRERTSDTTTTDSTARSSSRPRSSSSNNRSSDITHERDADREVSDEIEEILNDWRPGQRQDKRERQREVGRAVIEWLRDQKVASASEFKAEVEPAYPVEGQSPQTWWKKTGREALKRAQERGLVRFVDGRKEWRWSG